MQEGEGGGLVERGWSVCVCVLDGGMAVHRIYCLVNLLPHSVDPAFKKRSEDPSI